MANNRCLEKDSSHCVRHKLGQFCKEKLGMGNLTLVNADKNPREECLEREGATFCEVLVKLWVGEGDVPGHVFVKDK